MDKVQETTFTDYKAPSSEPFRLQLLIFSSLKNTDCVGIYVYLVSKFAYMSLSQTIDEKTHVQPRLCTKLQGGQFKRFSGNSIHSQAVQVLRERVKELNITCTEITRRFECSEVVPLRHIFFKLKIKTRKLLTLSGVSSSSGTTRTDGHPCNRNAHSFSFDMWKNW
jgi:hypothetical protein